MNITKIATDTFSATYNIAKTAILWLGHRVVDITKALGAVALTGFRGIASVVSTAALVVWNTARPVPTIVWRGISSPFGVVGIGTAASVSLMKLAHDATVPRDRYAYGALSIVAAVFSGIVLARAGIL